MNVKQRVINLIKSTGLVSNVSDLEKHLGLSNGTIANWDRQLPGTKNLIKVANFFDCSLDYLTERSSKPGINSEIDNYDIDSLLDNYLDRYHLQDSHKKAIRSVFLTYLNSSERQ